MSYRAIASQANQTESPVRLMNVLNNTEENFNQRLHVPDSYPGLIINLGAPLVVEMDDGTSAELPQVFFGRLFSARIKRIRVTGPHQCISFDLFAWGSRVLVGEHIDLASNPIVLLDGIWKDLAQRLVTVFHQRGAVETLAELEQFVADQHRRKRLEVTPVRTAMESLYASNGQFNLTDLADGSALSPSQLERQFKYHTGVSPKMLARLIRLDAVLEGLHDVPARQMTHLAHRFGYSDQAHFIHELKAFTGYTPSQYLSARG